MVDIVRDENRPSNQTVRCPLCNGTHIVKSDIKGCAYFSCPDIGGGTNVFPRTPLGKEKLKEWAADVPAGSSPSRRLNDFSCSTGLQSKAKPAREHNSLDEVGRRLLQRMSGQPHIPFRDLAGILKPKDVDEK